LEKPTAHRAGRDAVLRACGRDELRKLLSAHAQVVLVEDAFPQTAEEPGHAVLQHRSARGQQRRAGDDRVAQRQQVVLVAPGAVQQ
jgi:hypothetical protein